MTLGYEADDNPLLIDAVERARAQSIRRAEAEDRRARARGPISKALSTLEL